MKFYLDKDNELKKVFEKVREKMFGTTLLGYAKIKYLFWEGERLLPDGRKIYGETRMQPVLMRDVYGIDFIIAVDGEEWDNNFTNKDKIRLAWHELNHCVVVKDEKASTGKEEVPKYDNDGRVKVKIKHHDVNLATFVEEVERFGLPRYELQSVIEIHDKAVAVNNKEKKEKKNKKGANK